MSRSDPQERRELELKFGVQGPAAFAALAAAVGATAAPAVRQENRFYDTAAGKLRAARLALRVRDEEGELTLTAKGPRVEQRGAGDVLAVRAEEEVALSPAEAQALRRGAVHPLALFADRGVRAPLLERIARAVGEAPLVETARFVNHRARLGPVEIGAGEGRLAGLVFELDRTEFPGGRVDFEIEVEVSAAQAETARGAVTALLERSCIRWHPLESKLARLAAALRSSSPADP